MRREKTCGPHVESLQSTKPLKQRGLSLGGSLAIYLVLCLAMCSLKCMPLWSWCCEVKQPKVKSGTWITKKENKPNNSQGLHYRFLRVLTEWACSFLMLNNLIQSSKFGNLIGFKWLMTQAASHLASRYSKELNEMEFLIGKRVW